MSYKTNHTPAQQAPALLNYTNAIGSDDPLQLSTVYLLMAATSGQVRLPLKTACFLAGIKEKTYRNWESQGKPLPFQCTPASLIGCRRVDVRDLADYLDRLRSPEIYADQPKPLRFGMGHVAELLPSKKRGRPSHASKAALLACAGEGGGEMNATTLALQGCFQPLIKNRAKVYLIDLDDARQEAWLAIHMAVRSFNPACGPIVPWVATSIDTKLRKLAYGHGMDPLRYAGELDENLEAAAVIDQETYEIPKMAGIYGRIRELAMTGKDTAEIAHVLRLTPRRVEQLLADKAAILDAVRLARVQRDLFSEVSA